MTKRKFILYTMVPLFSEMVAFYCLSLISAYTEREGAGGFHFGLYVLCGMTAVLINCALAQRECSVGVLTAANVGMALVTEMVMFRTIEGQGNVFFLIFTAITFLYPVGRSLYLARNPRDANAMLIYTELSLLGTGGFLLLQISSFSPGPEANLLCLLAFVLNLCTLSSHRILSHQQNQSDSGVSRGFILVAAGILMVAVAIAVGLLIIPSMRERIFALIDFVKSVLVALAAVLMYIFTFLVSLFPADGEYELEQDPVSLMEFGEAAAPEMPAYLLPGILVLAGIAAAVLIVYLLRRFGKLRIRGLHFSGLKVKRRSNARRLSQILRAWIARLYRELVFRRRLLARYRTCAGVYLRLEKRGRRLSIPRRAGQTPGEYLRQLCGRVPQDEKAAEAFAFLAAEIDQYCFAHGKKHTSRVAPEQVRLMMRATRRERIRLSRMRAKFRRRPTVAAEQTAE